MFRPARVAFLVFLGCLTASGVACSSRSDSTVDSDAAPASTVDPSSQSPGPLTPPETVHTEQLRVKNGVKTLIVGNAVGRYHLWCNVKSEGCVTPIPGKDYLVFTKTTLWQFPGAKKPATLEFFQSFSVTYSNQENIALVPADQSSAAFGVYALNSWEKKP